MLVNLDDIVMEYRLCVSRQYLGDILICKTVFLSGIIQYSIIYHLNGCINKISRYKNGILHGRQTEYSCRGRIIEKCGYENGLLHGPYMRCDDVGRMSLECTYFKNHRHGIYKEYHPNGIISSMRNYQYGCLMGYAINYNIDGIETRREKYICGYSVDDFPTHIVFNQTD
jgi:antitoxin component YwqK of YwqJK toxin-antitoxin module